MRFNLLKRLLLTLVCSCLMITASATHVGSIDLSYEFLGGCTYRVKAKMYIHCGGALVAPPTLTFSPVGGPGCGNPTALGTGWSLDTIQVVHPSCPGSPTACSSTYPGFTEVEYYQDYDFCGLSCSYNIGISYCCRQPGLTHIVNPSSQSYYLEAGPIDPTVANSSPQFWDGYSMYACSSDTIEMSLGGNDPDGDSVVYYFGPTMGGGAPIPYNVGYSASQPFGVTWNATINQQTGDIAIFPINGGSMENICIGLYAEEWRNGTLISTSMRDLQFTTVSCGSSAGQPYITSSIISGGAYTGGSLFDIEAQVGTPLELAIGAENPNSGSGTQTQLYWNNNLPGGIFVEWGNPSVGDTIWGSLPTAHFQWTPPQPGTYFFTVGANDDLCSSVGITSRTYRITVPPPCNLNVTISNTDTLWACQGDMVTLTANASNGTPPYIYNWSNGSTTATILVGPINGPQTYWCQVMDPTGCTGADTVVILPYPTIIVDAGPDQSICTTGGSVQLNGSSTGSAATFNWTPATSLSNPSILNPTAAPPATTDYVLTAVDNNGCSYEDSMTVFVGPIEVEVNITLGDSLFCDGDSAILTASIVSGSATDYLWMTGEITPSITVFHSGTYGVWVANATCTDYDSANIYVEACVWPGDADNDGVANNFDLLAIGQSYGSTGSTRPNANLTWTGQPSLFWGTNLPSGTDYTYTDTDGNGLVNDDDTLAITQNYGFIHAKYAGSEGTRTDPLLSLLPTSTNIQEGDTVVTQILLGDMITPADSLYGIAFSITYDNTLIDSASAYITLNPSWFGTPSNDLISMQKDLFNSSQIDLGLSRNDQTERTGYGHVADLTFVMVDDVSGKTVLDSLELGISNVRAIRLDGIEIPIQTQGAVLEINEATSIENELANALSIFPNPAEQQLFVQWEKGNEMKLQLMDMRGRSLIQEAILGKETQLDVSHLPAGMYVLMLQNEYGKVIKKIEVR